MDVEMFVVHPLSWSLLFTLITLVRELLAWGIER